MPNKTPPPKKRPIPGRDHTYRMPRTMKAWISLNNGSFATQSILVDADVTANKLLKSRITARDLGGDE